MKLRCLVGLACALGLPGTAPAAPLQPPALAAESAETRFERDVHQFLESLWRLDPDAAIWAGRYEGAARLVIPDAARQSEQLAFIDRWHQHFSAVDAAALPTRQQTDRAMILARLESDRWQLTELREHEWNPSDYNIAWALDYILNTAYAPQPQRLLDLSARLAGVPAYYRAAQAAIKQPTREHTQLALLQAPGVLAVFEEIEKAARASDLKPKEKQQLAQRLTVARQSLAVWQGFLKKLDGELAKSGKARPFRLGAELYEAKFKRQIQAGIPARALYDKALVAREELLARMETLATELWPRVMGAAEPPADRYARIGAVIGKLSEQHVAPGEFYAEIRRQIPQLNDWVVSKGLLDMDPSKPLIVRETPLYQRGVAGAGIEAPGPYRPQDRTYYNVTPFDNIPPQQAESTLREYNHWILQILNIHEAIPGHYTQLVYANKSPSIVKTVFGNGAMIEGWAVYGERMMMESGWGGGTPEMGLMYSKWLLRTVSNTILDYSVHVLGMSEAEALDLLMRQAFQTEREAREKWRRVQLTSVQLTSYFSGYSEIMALREARRAALGEKFDLKRFHEEFLSYGSAPVAMIAALMGR